MKSPVEWSAWMVHLASAVATWTRPWRSSAGVWCALVVACTPGRPARENVQVCAPVPHAPVVLPTFLPDPGEPLNRGLWAVNHGLLVGVMQPSGRVYRAVVPPPVRQSIRDFTRNLTYPGRCVNHLLQGRWAGAGDESLRFLCNTTVGVAGFFDVASRWSLPQSEADFAQTFGRWGWSPQAYVMLPFIGPSDDCHAVGWAADEAAEPWNYTYPYRLTDYGTYYNELSDKAEEYVRILHAEADPYATVKYAWSYTSRHDRPDWRSLGAKDMPTLQTLGAARIACQDAGFAQRGRELRVRLPSTGRDLTFNCWLQPGCAPLVYVAPGLGSHRLSPTTLSLAEALYQNGFSVVTITNGFHPEFMAQAATSALPAYPPVDCHDLLVVLTSIDRLLEEKHPGQFGKRALVGFSIGGFETLHLAARERHQSPGLLHFDRYVAINSPVDLNYGATCIDGFLAQAAHAWPAASSQARANNALHKATRIAELAAIPTAELPFDATESQFLIGLNFRMILRDAIFTSQVEHDQGVLRTPLTPWRREPVYQEILGYSFRDYFLRFVVPYYHQRGIELRDFRREANLMNEGKRLHAQPKVRVVTNRNDFLLTPAAISWLESTLGPKRLKIFAEGGHLGNLASRPVQRAVMDSLSGLQ